MRKIVETKTDVGDMKEKTAKEIVGFFEKMDERRGATVDDIYKACVEEFKDYEIIDNRIIQEVIEESESRTYGVGLTSYGAGVSALINLSPEEEIYLKINYPWNYLGMYNEGKKIVIEGDAGNEIGRGMEGGEIHIGNLNPNQISKHARRGKIYRGIPPDAKLVWEGTRTWAELFPKLYKSLKKN